MDTPSAFHKFLQRVRHELPELAPVIDHQLELWEGEIFTTFILDALSRTRQTVARPWRVGDVGS